MINCVQIEDEHRVDIKTHFCEICNNCSMSIPLVGCRRPPTNCGDAAARLYSTSHIAALTHFLVQLWYVAHAQVLSGFG